MQPKFCRNRRIRIQRDRVKSSILEHLNASKGGTEEKVERFPESGPAQGKAQTARCVAHERDGRHPRKQAAFEENQRGMQMANDGSLQLRKFSPHGGFLAQKREGRGVMTKEQDLCAWFNSIEQRADCLQMLFAQSPPLRPLVLERFLLVNRKGQEARDHADENIAPDFHGPRRLDSQIGFGPFITRQAQTAVLSAHHLFADFVVSIDGAEVSAELLPQFPKT